ncbi:transcriptional regulator, putative [Pseudodesulfovibrio mercurii]|uniref:Transcriptional regulator, putative n=1 Tax=Pseudodesulfovibrio mercurii TaxID=641491 RepID=F0JDX8_9BACT|nr:WYL domain-containing protein [Pseudodesulfovibrio mercurii]EGB13418.1 transcriptional regulator, putative [Pseudodesulfovibrio mercurii]
MRGTQIIQLFKGIQALSKTNGTTINELMEVLGRNDRKAAYRMLETIQGIGVPVYEEKIHGQRAKRWKIDETSRQKLAGLNLPDFTISLPDIVALQLLRSQATVFKGTEIETTLNRLFSRLDAFVPEGLFASLSKLGPLFGSSNKWAKDYSGKEGILDSLVEAMLERRTCLVRYHSFQQGRETRFKIDPLYFFEYSGGLYLFVRTTAYDDIRILALERVREVAPTSDGFEEPKDFDARARLSEPFGIIADDPIEATVRVSADQARYLLERPYFRERVVAEESDGAVIVQLNTSGRHDVVKWILSLGSQAEVLGPPELRADVKKELEATLSGY